jgi:hypothetical protein
MQREGISLRTSCHSAALKISRRTLKSFHALEMAREGIEGDLREVGGPEA